MPVNMTLDTGQKISYPTVLGTNEACKMPVKMASLDQGYLVVDRVGDSQRVGASCIRPGHAATGRMHDAPTPIQPSCPEN